MARILVVGPGALGSVLAASLMARGFLVHLWGRRGAVLHSVQIDASAQPALLPSWRGTPQTFNFPLCEVTALADVDLVLVCVKAYDAAAALEALAALPELRPQVPIVLLANGDHSQALVAYAERHRQRPLRLGAVTVGVSVDSGKPGAAATYLVRSRAGVVEFGPLSLEPRHQRTASEELLTAGDSVWIWRDDALAAHRRKWFLNTVINTMAGAYLLPRNGDLLARESELKAVAAEAYALGRELFGAWPDNFPTMYQMVLELIRVTFDNENSMVRDLKLGRRSEADYLSGMARGRASYPLLLALDAKLSAKAE